MFRNKLAYAALIIVSAMFFIMYVDSLSMMLLIFVVLLPIVTFILGLIVKLMTDIVVEAEPLVVTKGGHTHILITAKNKSVITVSRVQMRIKYTNIFDKITREETIVFPVSAKSEQDFKVDLSSAHCGVINVEVPTADFYDFLKVWHYKKKLARNFEVTVIPESKLIDASVNLNTNVSFESDRFSKDKPGDDPSEVFKIRDYQGGDKLNRIHWKLSSKLDNLLVKDYSLPVDYSIVILLEISDAGKRPILKYIDGVIETAVSVSKLLIEKEICHVICWADGETGSFCEQEINNEEELYETIGMMIQTQICKDEMASLGAFRNCTRISRCSHLIYVTSGDAQNAAGNFGEYLFDVTVAHVSDDKPFADKIGKVNIVPVLPDSVEQSLSKIVL